MIKNKIFILPFLLLAWAIIFAHSIIPHHHHHSHKHICSHCHTEYHQNIFDEELNDHNDCNDQACHFHVEVLRQVSIDHVFITTSDNLFSDIFPLFKSEKNTFYIEAFYEPLFYSNQLRAPPIFV